MPEKKFEGKVVLITGGSSGIGLATAQEFLREGAHVIITGRDETTLSSSLKQLGGQALAVQADVSKIADTQRLMAEVGSRFSRVDVLVLNAGIPRYSPIGSITEEMFDEAFNINVKGVFFTMQKALPLLTRGAAVILVSSAIAHSGLPNSSIYAATKAAVISLGRTFSGELMERGIRVNVVSPGMIDTPMLQRFGLPPDEMEHFKENLRAQVPAKRFGEPKEIAKTLLFLASSDSSYIFGSEIIADGGMSLF